MQGLIGTNRMQLLPGLGFGRAEFIGTRVGCGGEVGSSWEEEVGSSRGRRSVISSVPVMDWAEDHLII